jgi:Pyruvate/2-oxoacid:ferredoxin oxidoreductase delta subunit
MTRNIVKIDEVKCDGCGFCSAACHENAIAIVNGKARLLRDDYCDGLGACLPACPSGAVVIEEREAAAFDESRNGADKGTADRAEKGTADRVNKGTADGVNKGTAEQGGDGGEKNRSNWPVQIRLVPERAAFFDGAELLISADCAAYRHKNFYRDFVKKSGVTLIACPKLDNVDYSVKLSEIIRQNDVKAVTLVRMEVPCCGGLERALSKAAGGKKTDCRVVTLSVDGDVLGLEEV